MSEVTRRAVLTSIGSAGLLVAITGCAPGATTAVTPSAGLSDAPSTTLPKKQATLTLSIVSNPAYEQIVQEFMKRYPTVTIKLQQTPFSSYETSLKLALASDTPPDIMQYSPGPMHSIIPAGLVLPLDRYEKAYDWGSRVSKSLLNITRTTTEAKQYGIGQLYAVPTGSQTLGIYYNKKLVQAAGIKKLPATLGQLEADFASLKQAGTTPLALGGLQVSAFQLWGGLTNVLGDPQKYVNWVYGKPGSTIKTSAAIQAADAVHRWVAKGYTLPQPNAIPDTQALADFSTGKAAYTLGRNANAAQLTSALGPDLGFFYLPPAKASDPAVTTGTPTPLAISSKSKNADVAAFFLNYLTTEKAATSEWAAGLIPVNPPRANADSADLKNSMYGLYEHVVAGAGISPFANFATSSMLDTLEAGMQGVIAGNMTSEKFVESLQSDWSQTHGN